MAAPLVPAAFAQSQAVTLYVGPATGTFTVGSTFTVSFYVNTASNFINAVEAKILFPADKLQVVSPSTGASFINVWAIQPSYSNTDGTMNFRGAVPSPGINTSAGLISTVTFRVKSVGNAAIRFASDSKVLLNDGLGTNVLQGSQSGVYTLILPPPSGPIVASPTHPDESRWYPSSAATLTWAGDAGAEGYSYTVSDEPVDQPDNISEGVRTAVSYKSLANGRHYFHIKALRAGVWGGVTHFALNVDTAPPAEFPIEFVPGSRTNQRQPAVKFLTTDADSGIDRYEVKMIALAEEGAPSTDKPLFIEAQSPYIPASLAIGRYDVAVRAYDVAGNYREATDRLEVVSSRLSFIQGGGFEIKNIVVIPWPVFWALAFLLLVAIGFGARRFYHRHHAAMQMSQGGMPADIAQKMAQLKEYQDRYGKAATLVLVLLVIGTWLFTGASAQAQQQGVLSPPIITTVSKEIFNDEIFYVGGHLTIPGAEAMLFIQDIESGQTLSYRVTADDRGEWFYRHTTFLPSGTYVIWAQARDGEQLSPPSPQVSMGVAAHAIKVGLTRISFETIYLVTIIILAGILAALLWIGSYHYRHGKRKHAKLMAERAKLEESVRRGFALLQRDIEEEVEIISHAKLSREISEAEKKREEQLLKDLEAVRQNIGEQVWELGRIEGGEI